MAAASLSLPSVGAAQEGADLAIEEVVVTARKREESLQDIPLSVTAFSNEQIQDLQIRDVQDIAQFTPGFSFVTSFGRDADRPVVRGMSNILGQANASFFLDGVFVPGSIASAELDNLERVEIIKGPQAALYGRATFAGAINYVTRRPTNEFEARVSATGAQHDQFEVSGSASGPIAEDFLYFFLAGSYYEYGGEYTNQLTGTDLGEEETRTFTGKLLLTPNDTFEATLRVTYQEDDDGHPALWLQPNDLNNCFDRNPDRPRSRGYFCGEVEARDDARLRTDFLPGGGGTNREVWRNALTLRWDLLRGHELTSLTGWQQEDLGRDLDVSYGGYDPLLYIPFADLRGQFWRVQDFEIDTISQELRLSSPQDQAFRYTVGGYYYREDNNFTVNDKVNPLTDIAANLDPNVFEIQRNDATEFRDIENVAFFAGVELDVGDRWTFTAEGRYAEDRLSFDAVNTDGTTAAVLDATYTSFTPRVTATFRQSDDVTWYANVALGNKPGGFNEPDNPVVAFDEEEAWNYEFGWKTQWMDGRMTWNSALFYIDWTDQQLTVTTQLPNGTLDSYIENVGETEVLGFETELRWLVTDNWTVDLTYAYIDSEIQEYINVDQAILLGCDDTVAEAVYLQCVQERGSVAGAQSPRSSEHQASLVTRYDVPLAGGRSWFVQASAAYESSRFAQVHNLAETGARTIVGLQTGIEAENWDLTLWAKNLFDDDTAQDILRYIDTQDYTNAPVVPCPPFAPGRNCGPFFAWNANARITPRGFAITLPRLRQVGVTLNYRF
jgi:outer membrane receptor protein involved in Fe transport